MATRPRVALCVLAALVAGAAADRQLQGAPTVVTKHWEGPGFSATLESVEVDSSDVHGPLPKDPAAAGTALLSAARAAGAKNQGAGDAATVAAPAGGDDIIGSLLEAAEGMMQSAFAGAGAPAAPGAAAGSQAALAQLSAAGSRAASAALDAVDAARARVAASGFGDALQGAVDGLMRQAAGLLDNIQADAAVAAEAMRSQAAARAAAAATGAQKQQSEQRGQGEEEEEEEEQDEELAAPVPGDFADPLAALMVHSVPLLQIDFAAGPPPGLLGRRGGAGGAAPLVVAAGSISPAAAAAGGAGRAWAAGGGGADSDAAEQAAFDAAFADLWGVDDSDTAGDCAAAFMLALVAAGFVALVASAARAAALVHRGAAAAAGGGGVATGVPVSGKGFSADDVEGARLLGGDDLKQPPRALLAAGAPAGHGAAVKHFHNKLYAPLPTKDQQ